MPSRLTRSSARREPTRARQLFPEGRAAESGIAPAEGRFGQVQSLGVPPASRCGGASGTGGPLKPRESPALDRHSRSGSPPRFRSLGLQRRSTRHRARTPEVRPSATWASGSRNQPAAARGFRAQVVCSAVSPRGRHSRRGATKTPKAGLRALGATDTGWGAPVSRATGDRRARHPDLPPENAHS